MRMGVHSVAHGNRKLRFGPVQFFLFIFLWTDSAVDTSGLISRLAKRLRRCVDMCVDMRIDMRMTCM